MRQIACLGLRGLNNSSLLIFGFTLGCDEI